MSLLIKSESDILDLKWQKGWKERRVLVFSPSSSSAQFVQCCEALRYVTGKNANAMKRWNGWGEETITPHLSGASTHFLQQIIGMGTPTRDATFAEVASCVPASRLPSHPLILTDSGERLLHTRGQSMPDWIAVRG